MMVTSRLSFKVSYNPSCFWFTVCALFSIAFLISLFHWQHFWFGTSTLNILQIPMFGYISALLHMQSSIHSSVKARGRSTSEKALYETQFYVCDPSTQTKQFHHKGSTEEKIAVIRTLSVCMFCGVLCMFLFNHWTHMSLIISFV